MKYMFFASMPMFVCGIEMAVLLLEWMQRPTRALRVLVIFMVVATFLYLGHFIYFMREMAYIPFTDTLYSIANPMVFPLYYIYIEYLTKTKVRWQHVVWLLIPSLLFGSAVGVIYALMDAEEMNAFVNGYLYKQPMAFAGGLVKIQIAAHQGVKVLFALEIIPVLYLGIKSIERYDKMLENNYSSIEDKRLTWVRLMLAIFTGTCIVSFVSNIIGRHQFATHMEILALPSTLFSLLLFTIGYVGMKQKGIEELDEGNIAVGEPSKDAEAVWIKQEPEPSERYDDHKIGLLRERIDDLMRNQKMYLQPQLKLNDLVRALNSNRNYVYQAINVDMNMSFSEYVNRMRIDYAKELIRTYPSTSFSEIAEKSGFSSSISFYRNFKLYVHCSPQNYRNKTLMEESNKQELKT